MKDIDVQCIVFTDECFSEKNSITIVFNSVLELIEGHSINIVFIQFSENSIIDLFTNFISFKDKSYQFIHCKRNNKDWLIKTSHEKSFLIDKDLPIEKLVDFIQTKYAILSAKTISVGTTKNHFILKSVSVLHFFVGDKTQLTNKVRGLIPLTDQYEVGLLNIISYFSRIGFKDELIKYHDLIDFVNNSREFFFSKLAASEVLQKHKRFTQCLKEKFPKEIIAIFGTGFPFYLAEAGEISQSASTPNSILDYFNIQSSYFSKKILSDDFFEKNNAENFTLLELDKIQIFTGRNKFDKYKYEMMGYPAPILKKTKQRTLAEYHSDNCFDVSTDIWPCYYCSTLQNNYLFPNQLEIKNTNISCLSCMQTSFMLRNIMGCSVDIDMVVVVNGNKLKVSEKINKYIYEESQFHFYDTNFHKVFKNNDGPLDLFITEKTDLICSLESLLLEEWVDTTFDSIALWSPNIPYNFHVGLDFAIAFEPVYLNDLQIQNKLYHIRKQFVNIHGIEKIFSILNKSSFYTEQLLSNENLLEILSSKLRKWV